MRKFLSKILTTSLMVLASATFANSGTIDFETIPGVAPFEGLLINTQFLASDGVTFSLEGGGSPVLAEVGRPRTAFLGFGNVGDTPAPGQGVGQFFLTDDGLTSGTAPVALIVDYSVLTASASGVILDIDGTTGQENFLIEAFDGAGGLLAMISIASGDADTGNGIATDWSFNLLSADIASIRCIGTRSGSGFFGLGFDNFDTGVSGATAIRLPAALPLYGTGLAILGFIGWRRKQRQAA